VSGTGTRDTIVTEIAINASAERIFEALVNPDQRMQWWGGEGRFRATHAESDLRIGGKWIMRFEMGGRASSVRGEYTAIDRPHLLAFTWLPDWYEGATETLVRFDLTENARVTQVRITHSGLKGEGDRANHRGWPDILAWLRAYAERAE
jgi:uncharacterized protein YndB with AHSA1/START domain